MVWGRVWVSRGRIGSRQWDTRGTAAFILDSLSPENSLNYHCPSKVSGTLVVVCILIR